MFNKLKTLQEDVCEVNNKVDKAIHHINEAKEYIKKHVKDAVVVEDLCDNILNYAVEELIDIDLS